MKFQHYWVSGFILALTVNGCGKKDDGNKGGGGMMMNGQSAALVTADFTSAVGVLVVDASNMGLRLKGFENASFMLQGTGGNGGGNQNENGDGSLVKVDGNGEVKSALSSGPDADDGQNNCCKMEIPRVQTIAVSPSKEIYLHFERPFVYKNPENSADWSKVWDTSNGYQCQIFKVKGGNIDELRSEAPNIDEGNLECLDNLHFVDSWQASRNSVFQFDQDSNVYYPGSLPNGGGKMVVYKYNAATKQASEVINSNICVQDFLVTKAGGVFYTGTSSCNGNGGGDGGFFRYVSPASQVREIARDWWNFVFEPVEGASGDQAVFFGPDPRSATTASWNSACLFNFDPAAGTSAAQSISEKITCGADIWSWINLSRPQDISTYGNYNTGSSSLPDAWVEEYKDRCTSTGNVFAGGGSQISSIKQDSTGQVYVIGKVRKKKEGSLTCSLSVKGPHCAIAGAPYLPGHSSYGTEASCQAAGGSWVINEGHCSGTKSTRDECLDDTGTQTWWYHEVQYNNIASDYCGDSASSNPNYVAALHTVEVKDEESGTVGAAATAEASTKFHRGWLGCQVKSAGGSNMNEWTDEYKALAKVDNASKTLQLLSSTDEQAINLWLISDVPYYSSFNTTQGKYFLKRWDSGSGSALAVAENFEAYNLSDSNEDGKLFYDGLDFGSNSYSFGTLLETAPYTRTIKTGLTGTVKTIVILPK